MTAADQRHRAAITRSARIGGSLARLVRARLKHVLDHLPEQIGPHDTHRLRALVTGAAAQLRHDLGIHFRRLLEAAATREYRRTAIALTRASGRHSEDMLDWLRLIVPAPALDFLERIVGPVWRRVLGAIDPDRAGNVVLQGVAGGKDRKQIAKELTDVFDGAESAARRVARTAGLQISTQAQLAVSEQIPDLVVGYSVYSVLDDRVRPEHRARHGFKYYRNPKKGQRGMGEMPHPPLEADGTVAWNCRCGLSPIIQIDGEEV